jgi:hypothetical protein
MLGLFSAENCDHFDGDVDPARSNDDFASATCWATEDCFLLSTFLESFGRRAADVDLVELVLFTGPFTIAGLEVVG